METRILTRTVTYKLDLPHDTVAGLQRHWSELCNYISKIVYNKGMSNIKTLYGNVYQPAREAFPDMPAYYVVTAIRHVLARYSTVRSNKHVIRKPLYFKDDGSVPLTDGNTISYLTGGLSIATHTGRIKGIQRQGGELGERYRMWHHSGGNLYVRDGKVYFAASVSMEAPAQEDRSGTVGVDVGIRNIAVMTDGQSGNKFYRGRKEIEYRNNKGRVRASLQRKKAQQRRDSNRSVRRVLRRLSGREKRYMKDTNHCISKAIVQFAHTHNAGTISFEKLSGIREGANKKGKRLRSSVNSWSYHQLQTFTEYKALAYGISTVYVDPRNTSKTCSKCGEIGHRVGDRFSCMCGYTLHADLNGARNIRARHMDSVRMSAGSKSFSPEIPSQQEHRLWVGQA